MARAKILLDFDGTVTVKDTVDAILERFAKPAWRDIEEDWKNGKIGSRECLSKQTALIHATPKEIDALIDEIEIDAGFAEFVEACERLKADVTIVSDGYRRSVERVLARGGYKFPSRSGVLAYKGRRRWRLDSPVTCGSCESGSSTCKCMVASEIKIPKILVGDGRSDFCISGKVDFVLAKGSLAKHCAKNGTPHETFSDLSEAAKLLAAYFVDAGAKRAA
jgi:2,3-diketo-5-methylthio-1-phosphopentane phosphatase